MRKSKVFRSADVKHGQRAAGNASAASGNCGLRRDAERTRLVYDVTVDHGICW